MLSFLCLVLFNLPNIIVFGVDETLSGRIWTLVFGFIFGFLLFFSSIVFAIWVDSKNE